MRKSDAEKHAKEIMEACDSLVEYLEAAYTPAQAYMACTLALGLLTVAMEIPLEVTLEGVRSAYDDLKAREGGGKDGTH